MNAYLKFALVALVCLLVGVPLWTLVLDPAALSPAMAVDPGFWIAVGAGLLFGFAVGNQADSGE